jgi:hypothetical protein
MAFCAQALRLHVAQNQNPENYEAVQAQLKANKAVDFVLRSATNT